MPLTITDFFEQVDGLSIEDAPPEVRARIDEELAELTDGITGQQGRPSTGASPGDPDVVVVDTDGEEDFETIQAAVDDAETDPGDTILIRPGRYATEGEITVTDPGELRLVGSGSGSGPSSNTVVEGQLEVEVEEAAGNGVTMRDLRIEGVTDDGAEIDATAAFGGSALREIGVENVAFVGNDFEGLDIQDPAEDLAVRDCLIESNGDNGIEGEDITNAVVSNCTIKNNDGQGIDFDAVDSLVIDGCTIRDNGGSGIEFDSDAANLEIAGSEIDGNIIKGVEFDGDGVAITVTSSSIENNGEQGIVTNRLTDSSSSITDAEFRDTTVSNNGFEGVGLFANNIETLVFEDLDVLSNGFEGIDLFGNDIGDVDVSNVTADDNGGIGIALGDTFDEMVSEVSTVNIRDTSASGNGSEGVLLATERVTDVTLANVTTSNNVFEGIDLFGDEVGMIRIDDATAEDNGGIGIALGGSVGGSMTAVETVDIRNSTVRGNSFEGVLVSTEKIAELTLASLSVSNNVFEGIDLFANELANVTISRVTARDNDGVGVFIGNSNTDAADIDNLLIERSVVAGNGADFADGIAVAGDTTDGATITDSNVVDNVGDGVSKSGSGTVNVKNSFLNGNDVQSDGNVTITGLRSDPVSEAGVNSN